MTKTILVPLLALVGCTARELPPPTVPAQLLPPATITMSDPPPGQTTVMIDTSGEPATVEELAGTSSMVATNGAQTAVGFGISTNLVCTTPCTAHLAQGQHQLMMRRVSDGEWAGEGRLDVGIKPVAYRYALGHANTHALVRYGGLLMATVGGSLLLASAIPYMTGDSASPTLTISGAALTVVGVALIALFRPEIQNGAGTQWEIPATAASR